MLGLGVLLGIARHSFGVAQLLSSGAFPARHKASGLGHVMGLLGADNGAMFQLASLRWPGAPAVAGSMTDKIGPLGWWLGTPCDGPVDTAHQRLLVGLWLFALPALAVLLMMRSLQSRWTRTWA